MFSKGYKNLIRKYFEALQGEKIKNWFLGYHGRIMTESKANSFLQYDRDNLRKTELRFC